MKRGISFILVFLGCSIMAYAQTNQIQKNINSQYVDSKHKQFLYTVSKQNKSIDELLIQNRQQFEDYYAQRPEVFTSATSDTTWSYSESKGLHDSLFTAGTYSHYYSMGDTLSSSVHYNQYQWVADSAMWMNDRVQTSFISNQHYDSVKTYFYHPGVAEPFTGNRTRYPLIPSQGADYEVYWDYYEPGTGWVPSSWDLSYQDENGSDTLRISHSYSPDSMSYYLSSKDRYLQSEQYYFYEYINYSQNGLSSISKEEDTPEFYLSEYKSYDYEGVLSYWDWDYIKKLENGAWDYHVRKEYDNTTMSQINRDSSQYIYSDDNTEIASRVYFWGDSLWIYDQLNMSYQTALGDNDFQVDSIVIYDVDYNEETMMREPSGAIIKTFMQYDMDGNQVRVDNYSIINDSLQQANRTEREFTLINDYPTIIKQETFAYDHSSSMIYRSSIFETKYNGNTYAGTSFFSFNALGDTTYGYINQYEQLADGSTADVRFDWDWHLQTVVLRSYRINGRKITGDDGRQYNQNVYVSINPTDGKQAINRSMNGYNSWPGVFNDGPIYIEMGDTLNLFLSARNPDMTLPMVEVSNLPSTATFDSETRRLSWIVDEENPSPMTYKAVRGDMFVTTEVEFINENFSVSAEESTSPFEFKLDQNYPNPFNPSTNINFSLPVDGLVSLKVYNILGQEVMELINQRMAAGNQSIKFDGSQLSSGVYIYRLQAGNLVQTKKMMLIK